jgi:plasmid stabilization system protein ParE
MVFRVGNRNERVIEVLRLLHDAMEVRRYLPQ